MEEYEHYIGRTVYYNSTGKNAGKIVAVKYDENTGVYVEVDTRTCPRFQEGRAHLGNYFALSRLENGEITIK